MYMKNMTRLVRFSVIYGAVIVILGLIAGCGEESSNSPPVIDSFEASFTDVVTNSEVILTVSATDDDGDELTYTYRSTGGTISGTGSVVIWIAPATAGNYTITVDISDGELNAENLITITVVEEEVLVEEDLVEKETMVLIPADEFEMGDHHGVGFDDEQPVHTVYLDAFYIDKYEVTNAQYRKFMDATGHSAPGYWNDALVNAPKQPVVGLSWHDAVAYAEWEGKRLPTEAEWEKAARGGLVGKRYPWGDEAPDAGGVYRANYDPGGFDEDGYFYTSPVGSFAPNGYGLYDMAGNVWEWCADWRDGGYYANSPYNNPLGPDSGSFRVLRGGSWLYGPGRLRVADRDDYSPSLTDINIGFRCVSQD